MKWKILSSEYLFDDLWFRVRKDTCEAPDGKIIDPYYVYEFPEWATAFPLTENGEVIMVKQYRHAAGEVCIELPGGCIDDTDKSNEEAVARELMEETGYSFSSFEYLGRISANPSTNNNMMHMFLARGGRKVKEQQLEGSENIQVELHTIDEVKKMLRKNEIIQAMHVTCILYAFAKLGVMKI